MRAARARERPARLRARAIGAGPRPGPARGLRSARERRRRCHAFFDFGRRPRFTRDDVAFLCEKLGHAARQRAPGARCRPCRSRSRRGAWSFLTMSPSRTRHLLIGPFGHALAELGHGDVDEHRGRFTLARLFWQRGHARIPRLSCVRRDGQGSRGSSRRCRGREAGGEARAVTPFPRRAPAPPGASNGDRA